MFKMKFHIFVSLCLLHSALTEVEIEFRGRNARESRKLFGGYRITPRFCKPTRKNPLPTGGPSICMFNHECSQRNGQVIGACMDGFLFGACCQLPLGSTGELIESDINPVSSLDNNLPTPTPPMYIMSSELSQITQSLLNDNAVLPTAQDDAVVQVNSDQVNFSTPGVTQTRPPDTFLVSQSNKISAQDFTKRPLQEDSRQTTVTVEESTKPYSERPMIHISISSSPSTYTPAPYQKPMFRPKPAEDKYVLVPTISHNKNNKTQQLEVDSIVNILHMLNQSTATTTRRPASPSSGPTSTRKPPSTSYVYSTTNKPLNRRTTTPTKTRKPTTTKHKKTTTRIRPSGYSTVANSPLAFVTSTTTRKPPSTSYVYSPTPTRRPPSTINTHIAGPSFSVTSSPLGQSTSSKYPSPAPTVIVLSPATADGSDIITKPPPQYSTYNNNNRKPPVTANSVTINNHVTQNIYSTSERPPQPTVLITPKPSISTISTSMPVDYYNQDQGIEVGANDNDLSNFPPVRNPNLNMSNPVSLSDDDLTTPAFVEDEVLDQKVESFVNQIIQGLQEPFQGLKDVVYDKNGTTVTKKPTTTKKPVKTTKRPTNVRTTTTKKPTRKPASTTVSTRRPTSNKRPVSTKKPQTTTESLIIQDEGPTDDGDKYRDECGIRPLLKTGRIVGGRGATYGEFPWQVLVRESTWLGLFTKNKCGGVLISNKYVMTAAHCQPGFLASLVAVFGEFDISGDLESRRPLSRNVKRVIVHRKYNPETFENDLALLELDAPIKFDAHIIPICLPRDGEDFTGRMATVTGWGRLKYGGGVPSVLQEVQVPIMENPICQEMFRTAGHLKVIRESFLCAGYANGQKDSCEGDSGGPLVLQRPDARYQLVGTVSHGIKCAAPYLPGVYMRTTFFKPWIVAITGIDTSS